MKRVPVPLCKGLYSMNSGEGGARHTPKPQVDTSLLAQCFLTHKDLLAKLGAYENMSKNQACSPKGIVQVLPLLEGLVDLESTCEIHGSCLRAAIMEVLTQDPGLNTTAFKGSVWVGSRVDRITTIMYHLRRLKGSVDLKHCAASLTSLEFLDLQNVLEKVVKKEMGEKHLPLAERDDAKPLAERDDAKPLAANKVARAKTKVSKRSQSMELLGLIVFFLVVHLFFPNCFSFLFFQLPICFFLQDPITIFSSCCCCTWSS